MLGLCNYFSTTKATKVSLKIAKRGKTCFPSFAKKSYGGQRMAQRSLIKEYEPRRKIYGVFYKIDIAPFLKGAISIVAVKYYWTMNLPERVVLAVMNWYR